LAAETSRTLADQAWRALRISTATFAALQAVRADIEAPKLSGIVNLGDRVSGPP